MRAGKNTRHSAVIVQAIKAVTASGVLCLRTSANTQQAATGSGKARMHGLKLRQNLVNAGGVCAQWGERLATAVSIAQRLKHAKLNASVTRM